MKPSASDIIDGLFSHFTTHDYKLRNSYVFPNLGECDFFSLNQSGYTYEVEVKISRGDFFKDFEKLKHTFFKRRNEKAWPIKGSVHRVWSGEYEETKHGRMAKMTDMYTDIQWIDPLKALMPNKFFYATPNGLLKLDEVPEYAGLLEFENRSISVIKNAPFLHKRKIKSEINNILLDKFYYLAKELSIENKTINRQNDRLKKDILKLNPDYLFI